MRSRDTSSEARQVQQSLYRRMGPDRRVEIAFEMSEHARALSVAGIRERDRTLSPGAARRAMLRRLLGEKLFDRAWPSSGDD